MNRFLLIAVAVFVLSCGNDDAMPTTVASDKTDSSAATNGQPVTANPDEVDKQSVSELENRHALVPSDPAIAYDLAYAYAEQKNAKAVRLADSLIKAKAREVEKAHYSKAEYYAQSGNTAEALKAYDAAIVANLRFLDAHLDKGQLLFNNRRYDDALKTFAIGQKLSVSEPLFYLWIAKTQEAMGSREDAKANYERAYVLDKTLTEAKEAAERLE